MITEYQGRTFDWVPEKDERSRKFGISALGEDVARSYTWRLPLVLDQGPDGACVGFSCSHSLAARPKASKELIDYNYAMDVYHTAQRSDEWEGEAYEGTSVLAGMKTLKERGAIKEYRWAFTVPEILVAVSRHGGGVLGTWWYSGMMEVDENGFLRVEGDRVGGHAIFVRATRLVFQKGTTTAQKKSADWYSYLDKEKSYVILHNSWGSSWAGTLAGPGTAKVSVADLEFLMSKSEEGEFAIPVK